MKKLIVVLAFAVIMTAGWYGFNKTISHDESNDNLLLENIEALSDIESIGGKWYIVDRIPCASAGNEVLIHKSYVNCTDCKTQHGAQQGLPGECTNVRPI